MTDAGHPDRFDWLDASFVERLGLGVPLIILGAADQFDKDKFRSEGVKAQFKDLRDQLKKLKITRLAAHFSVTK